MKKLLLLLIIPLLFSCGEKELTLCDCTDFMLAAYFTPFKIGEDSESYFKKKYGDKVGGCQKLFEPFVNDGFLLMEKLYNECEGFEDRYNLLMELAESGEPTGYERCWDEKENEIECK